MWMRNYLDDLNEAQRRAVEHTEGPLLVLAGAGAGKTKTISYRILHLINKGVAPHQILAVTFTNKAAKEMKERVATLLGSERSLNTPIYNRELPFLATFHSLGVEIIKQNSSEVGLTKHFSIYDRGDSKRAIKDALTKKSYNPKEFEPGKILSAISREKGDFVTEHEYREKVQNDYYGIVVSEVWEEYQSILKKENALDFDDLLLVAAKLLEKPDIKNYYNSLWQYIHIDEYQDTNKVQYKIAKMLAGEKQNIAVVGDVDQNIYSWRGANIRNILNFEKDFQNPKIVLLEENYRSTQMILAVANRAIEKNKLRMEKKLVTRNNMGEKLSVFEGLDESHEAKFVAKKIKELHQNGVKYTDIAVLYRANFQSRALEEACLRNEVPYQVLGTKFFERKEIKDILSFLRLSLNPDSIADLKRVINVPPRGIGKVTLLKIVEGKEDALPAKTKILVKNFREIVAEIKKFALENDLSQTIEYIAEKTGILRMIEEEEGKSEEGQARKDNIKELVGLARIYNHEDRAAAIEKFLENAALSTDQDESRDEEEAVRLMTVHASKGLEFDYIFITGLEEGLFPSDKNRDQNVSEEEAEEERRLFYVAITRAKKKLFLSYAASRAIYGSRGVNIPSEFLVEIPEEYLEKEYTPYERRHKPLLDIEF